VTTQHLGPRPAPNRSEVRTSRHGRPKGATALDHKSGTTRIIVWLAFVTAVIWALVAVSWLVAPKPLAAPSWSTQVGGLLQVQGRPTVSLQATGTDTAIIRVNASAGAQQTYRIQAGDLTQVRTFWRGTTLVIDTGSLVWRIDSKLKLLLRAPDSYGWHAA
jgi:hypothetical protein